MNDLIFADRELEVGFIGQLDALLEGIERWMRAIRLRWVTNNS